jgi:hypothetical protein
MNRNSLIILVLMMVLSGCGKKISQLFYRDPSLLVREIKFDYFSGKLKVDFDGDKKVSGTANLRVRKDSVIWMSLSPGLGVEVARVLITQDSIFVIDKFNKKYINMDFVSLSKKFEFDIDYHLVESVILGNLIHPYKREKYKKAEGGSVYEQVEGKFLFQNTIGNNSKKLEKLTVTDTTSRSSINVNYSDFQQVEDQVLPFLITAVLKKGYASAIGTKVEIVYSKAVIEKKTLKFPFSIPDKYERSETN